jgi:hypothetical protein
VGVVSVGDVLLNNLKQQIELAGINVEFKLTTSGGVLICGSQVSYLYTNVTFSNICIFVHTQI